MTLKQLEALYWAATLGGFQHAANKLHTTQSTISQRIAELEDLLGAPLFDRSTRNAKLTEKGAELLSTAQRMLELRDQAIEQLSLPNVIERTYRIGVTELTAMTWLPRLIALLKTQYPKLTVEPYVDMSMALKERLLAEELDLMIAPDAYPDLQLSTHLIGSVENAWMCKPGAMGERRALNIHELADKKMLTNKSGPGLIYQRWFREIGFAPDSLLASNSIVALVALVVSGVGVSYLPRNSLLPLIEAGRLEELDVSPPLPPIDYVAVYKTSRTSALTSSIIMLAQECCDFDHVLKI
jgi:DNA-binding transcriptional LysR family regulator